MWRIRSHQIDASGDNFSRDEIDIGENNSNFRIIKSAKMEVSGYVQYMYTWGSGGGRVAVRKWERSKRGR
jgi:hypothetical protein